MNRQAPWIGLILAAAAVAVLVGCPPAGSSSDGGGSNTVPVLANGVVTPSGGDPTTTFTYQVEYSDVDGQAPSAIQVHIDGTAFPMTLQSGAAHDGAYTYATTLAAGSHTYYFTCDDGNGGSGRHPGVGESSGPTVTTPGNNDPALSGGTVTPASGDTATTFTYSVGYSDADGDAPTLMQVVIDGAAQTMTLASGVASNGIYQYSTTLSATGHNYYFACEDGNGGSDRVPAASTLPGPTVTVAKNTLSGSVAYSGAETIGASKPIRVEVWDPISRTVVDSTELTASPYSFSFDLDPDTYAVYAYIDSDQSGTLSEDDIFVIYGGIHFLDDYDAVDLRGGDQGILISLDDSNVYAFFEDFQDGTADGWVPVNGDPRWQVVGDTYRMVGVTDGNVTGSLHACATQDFTFSVGDLQQLAGDYAQADWGVFFRFAPNPSDIYLSTGYALGVSNDGWWGIYLMDDTPLYEEQSFTPGDTVTVEVAGESATVYINGVQRHTVDLSAYGYSGGYVVTYAWDDSSTGTNNVFSYDDIWLVLHP